MHILVSRSLWLTMDISGTAPDARPWLDLTPEFRLSNTPAFPGFFAQKPIITVLSASHTFRGNE
jgi:hypothetical protein